MSNIRVALLLSSVIVSVACANKGGYLKHKKMLEEFCCGEPQPRVFELEDVLDKETLDDLIRRGLKSGVNPSVTVLQRCESTGYCEDPKRRCVPLATEPVTLTFSYPDGKMRYHDVHVENHIKCGCRLMDEI